MSFWYDLLLTVEQECKNILDPNLESKVEFFRGFMVSDSAIRVTTQGVDHSFDGHEGVETEYMTSYNLVVYLRTEHPDLNILMDTLFQQASVLSFGLFTSDNIRSLASTGPGTQQEYYTDYQPLEIIPVNLSDGSGTGFVGEVGVSFIVQSRREL